MTLVTGIFVFGGVILAIYTLLHGYAVWSIRNIDRPIEGQRDSRGDAEGARGHAPLSRSRGGRGFGRP